MDNLSVPQPCSGFLNLTASNPGQPQRGGRRATRRLSIESSTLQSRAALCSKIATSHMWPFEVKYNEKIRASVSPAIFKVLRTHTWLMVGVLDNVDIEHFQHCRKFSFTVLA